MYEPLISAIIPNYNYELYVGFAIDSVLSQTYSNIEIIVVDDGSSDGSRDVLAAYGDRIKVVFQQNQGVSAARNAGVEVSRGELIAFLDADDVWLPTKIEKQVMRFAADKELGLVHVGVEEVDADNKLLHTHTAGLDGSVSEKMVMLTHESIFGGGSGSMIPRTVFHEVGGFDTRISTSADWDLHYRISDRYKVGFVPEILLTYRVHGTNMHGNVRALETDMMLAFKKIFTGTRPAIARLKRPAFGRLHRILAGSHFVAGNYPAFLSHSLKSLYFSPRSIAHFLKLRRMPTDPRANG